MKKFLVGLVVGGLVASAGTATAMSQLWLRNGVACAPGAGGVACVLVTGDGYGIGISSELVFVRNLDTRRNVFVRMQP